MLVSARTTGAAVVDVSSDGADDNGAELLVSSAESELPPYPGRFRKRFGLLPN